MSGGWDDDWPAGRPGSAGGWGDRESDRPGPPGRPETTEGRTLWPGSLPRRVPAATWGDRESDRDPFDEGLPGAPDPSKAPIPGTVAVTGSTGLLGRALIARARAGRWTVVPLGGSEPGGTDVTDAAAVRARLTAARPSVVIHAAAWTDLEGCEGDPDRAVAVHGAGTAHVVAAARAVGAHVVALSTECVFSGTLDRPYREDDSVGPRSVYGRSKLVAEREVPAEFAVVRTSWLVGAEPHGFTAAVLAQGHRGRPFPVVADQWGCPTPVGPLADALLELGRHRSRGIWHVVGPEPRSRHQLAQELLAAAGLDPALAVAVRTHELDPRPRAERPANGILEPARWRALGLPDLPHHRAALADIARAADR